MSVMSLMSIRIVLRPKNRNVNPEDLMNSLFEQTELKINLFSI